MTKRELQFVLSEGEGLFVEFSTFRLRRTLVRQVGRSAAGWKGIHRKWL